MKAKNSPFVFFDGNSIRENRENHMLREFAKIREFHLVIIFIFEHKLLFFRKINKNDDYDEFPDFNEFFAYEFYIFHGNSHYRNGHF